MSVVAVLGMQWGDEGKGKIVDYLTEKADAVVRFHGGHNAGHTIMVARQKIVLHLLPSGIMHPQARCFIGSGVVLSTSHLFQEIDAVEQQGVEVRSRLSISPLCPLLFSCHRMIDQAREKAAASDAIGTTGRGIGPAYEDKVARRGLRLCDFSNEKYFVRRLRRLFDYHNFLLKHYYKFSRVADADSELENLLAQRTSLLAMMKSVSAGLRTVQSQGGNILCEGAQGTMLDIDHGTYPYVTSSSTVAGNISSGTGMPPFFPDKVIGVVKAYTTRVGNGPFPTELDDTVSRHLGQFGNEFGATTGRIRRCGWLDMAALRHAVRLNGVTSLGLTKLDVLRGLQKIKICTGYKNTDSNACNYAASACRHYLPVYEEFCGWEEDISSVRVYEDLPHNAQNYIRFIAKSLAVPVNVISVSPERGSSIMMRPVF